ncbi:MAG: hypothetical protein U9O87_01880 [Verrucomicrobiota bacterium]|nr:hypothetical protein [Verrucomicrobiota bacterium]
MKKLGISLLITVLSLNILVAQQNNATPNPEIPELKISDAVSNQRPENSLPGNAILHIQLASINEILKKEEELLLPFIPEKILPPELKTIFDSEKPLKTLLGTKTLGAPLTSELIKKTLGINPDMPLTVTFYPGLPKQSFIISIPFGAIHPFTGLIINAFGVKTFEEVSLSEKIIAHIIKPKRPKLSKKIFLVCSETRAYFCGNRMLANRLSIKTPFPKLDSSKTIKTSLKKYKGHLFTAIADPAAVKPIVMMMAMAGPFSKIPPEMIQEVKETIKGDIRLQHLRLINIHLKTKLGINDLDELLSYLECFATASYEVFMKAFLEKFQGFQGIALSADLQGQVKVLQYSLFSDGITPEESTKEIPLNTIKRVLKQIGSPSSFYATGKTLPDKPSELFKNWKTNLRQKFDLKSLQTEKIMKYFELLSKTKDNGALSAKTDFVLKTSMKKEQFEPASKFNSLKKYLEYLGRNARNSKKSPLTIIPENSADVLIDHMKGEGEEFEFNKELCRNFCTKNKINKMNIKTESRFFQKKEGETTTLTLENAYIMPFGLFGYTQHELINRKSVSCRNIGNLLYFYNKGADSLFMKTINPQKKQSSSSDKIIDMLPEDSEKIYSLRILQKIKNILPILTKIENLIHREFDNYLQKANDTIIKNPVNYREKLLNLEQPMLMQSLNKDKNTGKLYCITFGNLAYPRPKIMPLISELCSSYLAEASKLGGSAFCTTTKKGIKEGSLYSKTDAIAFLVKSSINNLYTKYLQKPDGKSQLKKLIIIPKDKNRHKEEIIIKNLFMQKGTED